MLSQQLRKFGKLDQIFQENVILTQKNWLLTTLSVKTKDSQQKQAADAPNGRAAAADRSAKNNLHFSTCKTTLI